jgi:hypothetical protein
MLGGSDLSTGKNLLGRDERACKSLVYLGFGLNEGKICLVAVMGRI